MSTITSATTLLAYSDAVSKSYERQIDAHLAEIAENATAGYLYAVLDSTREVECVLARRAAFFRAEHAVRNDLKARGVNHPGDVRIDDVYARHYELRDKVRQLEFAPCVHSAREFIRLERLSSHYDEFVWQSTGDEYPAVVAYSDSE